MNDKQNQFSLGLSQHVVYICSRFLAYNLPLLFFLVAVSFYLKTYDSAQIKITFTQIGGVLLLFLWLTKILVEGRSPFSKRDLVYVAPFIAFLCSGLIAYAHTPFKGWALEETSRRVFYMTFALVAIAEMKSNERMTRLWRWLLAAAWFSIGYGFIQYLDSRFFRGSATPLDPFIWRQAFGPRVFSTFGNPNFYGNFLVIMTPLIFASVLRYKASLSRPFFIVLVTVSIVVLVDKMTLGLFGGYDTSYRVVFAAIALLLVGAFIGVSTWGLKTGTVSAFLVLFGLLFLNLFSTETKGAWVGFVAAVAITMLLITEYFLRWDEHLIEEKKYIAVVGFLIGLFTLLYGLLFLAFVRPVLRGEASQIGFSILWIPVAAAFVVSIATLLWVFRKPWNLKKLVYGFLILFVVAMGGGVLQYASARLMSVSFRIFTWISTWEMVRTSPLIGNGVGTFKVIYPAFRRPEIIVLEGKSNTETDHAEDEYIETWQDEGIIGFGILIWLITLAIACGLKQLRWYAKLRAPGTEKKKKFFEIESDPRSYEVLGILGAYMGALVHWTMDVSIRFVSSGIFSGLLPGVLVSYAKNHQDTIRDEVRLPYERWIRVSTALFWTGILIGLNMSLVPDKISMGNTTPLQKWFFSGLAGAVLFVLLEVLEWGNKPERVVPFEEQYPPRSTKAQGVRIVALIGVFAATGFAMRESMRHFQADVHHNLAIFFSKQSIWDKSPLFDAKVAPFPADIKRHYKDVGGALQHYAEVIKNNPNFPMALYFTGNVYNDWGTQKVAESEQARASGKMDEAARFRAKAAEYWELSEQAYDRTKKLAPNYVQTHHQVGLLFTKRAEVAMRDGNPQKAKELYEKALYNFRLYRMLDPVFPANLDRMAQILLMDKKYDEAIEIYKTGVHYNDTVGKSINKTGSPHNVSPLATSLGKIYYTRALEKSANPFQPLLPEVEEAVKYFRIAAESIPSNLEAWKGLGFLLTRMGRTEEAQVAYRKAVELAPNDPELKAGLSIR